MLNPTIEWLKRLLDMDSLPASTVSKSIKSDIDNILSLGFIEWKRRGAGASYYINDAQAIKNIISSSSYKGDILSLTPKAKAVALHGDAHKGKDDSILLMLSATHKDAMWSNGIDELDVYEYVSLFGVASLVVKLGDNWSTIKPIALVENLDLLIYAKQYFKKIGFDGTVLYYSGMVSGMLLQWLSEKNRGTSYIMFPDYDIVGLNNYIRAKKSLGDMLSMYIPKDLARLLSDYGNDNTLMNSNADRTTIEKTEHEDVISVYKLLLEKGKTLHQEGLALI